MSDLRTALLGRNAAGDVEVIDSRDNRLLVDGTLQVGDTNVSEDSPLPVGMQRYSNTITVTIANGAAVSDTISFHDYTMLIVEIPAAWTAARLAILVSYNNAAFLPLYDDAGNLVRFNGGANVAVDTAYVAPPEMAGSLYIQLWSENGAGGDTNQGADRSLVCHLKA